MKIITWNVGLFSWYKYSKYFNFKLNNQKVKNEYFHIGYKNFVISFLKEQNADICVLQEFFTDQDRDSFVNSIKDMYPYHVSISAWYHHHCILVLSKKDIKSKMIKNTQFNCIESYDKKIIPIHLHSFSVKKRFLQIKELIQVTNIEDIDLVIGDTNFWSFGNYFLFKKDRDSFNLLEKYFHIDDILFTSKVFLNFDRVFINKKNNKPKTSVCRISHPGMDHYPVITNFN